MATKRGTTVFSISHHVTKKTIAQVHRGDMALKLEVCWVLLHLFVHSDRQKILCIVLQRKQLSKYRGDTALKLEVCWVLQFVLLHFL